MKRRVGLVGAGYICEYHIAAIRRLPDVELVGITDLDAARAAKTGEKFKVPVFASLKALKEAGANAIHVLTPPHTHTAITLEALDLGCDVLVEKPLSEDPADGARIQARAAEYGLKVCVNHSLLFDPADPPRAQDRALRQDRADRVDGYPPRLALSPFEGGPLRPSFAPPATRSATSACTRSTSSRPSSARSRRSTPNGRRSAASPTSPTTSGAPRCAARTASGSSSSRGTSGRSSTRSSFRAPRASCASTSSSCSSPCARRLRCPSRWSASSTPSPTR